MCEYILSFAQVLIIEDLVLVYETSLKECQKFSQGMLAMQVFCEYTSTLGQIFHSNTRQMSNDGCFQIPVIQKRKIPRRSCTHGFI